MTFCLEILLSVDVCMQAPDSSAPNPTALSYVDTASLPPGGPWQRAMCRCGGTTRGRQLLRIQDGFGALSREDAQMTRSFCGGLLTDGPGARGPTLVRVGWLWAHPGKGAAWLRHNKVAERRHAT
jgi:hypothetical protein